MEANVTERRIASETGLFREQARRLFAKKLANG
jgi:hypothetical protein